MKVTGAGLKLAALSLVLLAFTGFIIVVFGQMRFDRTVGYTAEFTNISGLRAGQFVRANGVEVGKVRALHLEDRGRRIVVDFDVDESLHLYQSTSASVRYLNLIGDRFLELERGDGDDRPLVPGSRIPMSHTHPALDLDALIGGFKPLFRALDPDKVNGIASSLITVFQGQGGTINDVLDQTAQLTSALADRDRAVGEVIDNLNGVLDTTVKHQDQLDQTIDDFQKLISGLNDRSRSLADGVENISNAAGTIADLLADNRSVLQQTVGKLDTLQQPIVDDQSSYDDLLTKLPRALTTIGRTGGIYGDFFNFYFCDLTLKVNGLQPGGPVRTVKIFNQPSGRCTPR